MWIMEGMAIDNKNKINSYQPTPTLFYDIEGVLLENKGRDVKVGKTIGNKLVEYSLRLIEELDREVGENIRIGKEEIVSCKVEEKEKPIEDDKDLRKAEDILKELGLEYTEENLRMVEYLINSGIPITKNKVDSYIQSKEYLNKIIEDIDPNSFVKLMDRGIDLEDDNLQNISRALEAIKNEERPFSIKRFMKLEKDLTYKEAEEISREIYGQKMGKDVYDTIMALNKEKLPITKENIDKITEVMGKLYDLRGLEDEAYIKILDNQEIFNIDNLFKLKNAYTVNNIEGNLIAESFEGFTVVKETTIDSLKEILEGLGIEETMENIWLLREFIVNNMDMDKESYNKVISMKEGLRELRELIDHGEVGKLIYDGIDPIKEDIHQLVEGLKREKTIEEPMDEEKAKEIIGELELLGKIQDKDLLKLLRQGEDFNLKSIKEIINTNLEKELTIEYKTLDRTNHITNILSTLGSDLNLETISLASRNHNTITLENLYTSHKEVDQGVQSTEQVDKVQQDFIFSEYLKARNNLTTNMVKQSIKDGKVIENMPLNEVNQYVEKKINRYKEAQRMTREIFNIKGNEEKILPIIMKNDLQMTLKEIKDINEFLNGEKGLSRTLKSIIDENSGRYTEEFKEEIKLLQKTISGSMRNGEEDVKDAYKELIFLLENSGSSLGENPEGERDGNKGKDYVEIQGKISNKDLLLQFPIDSGGGYEDLNIIIPYMGKTIDKNNMSFSINLETENLGLVHMDLKIVGKEIQIHLKEEGKALEGNMEILKTGLEKLGYRINMEVEPRVI